MGRLKTMPPRLGVAPPRLATTPIDAAGRERERTAFNPLRPLYKTARWRDLRIATFKRDHFTCQMCGRIEGNTSRLTADHRKPHRGDLVKFWDPDNLQTLCTTPCHVKHKQRLEQAAEYR